MCVVVGEPKWFLGTRMVVGVGWGGEVMARTGTVESGGVH